MDKKEYQRIKQKEYYERAKNTEKFKVRKAKNAKKWAEENKEKIKLKNKEWYENNQEKIKEYYNKYYETKLNIKRKFNINNLVLLENEIWKDIIDFNYQISNYGRVMNKKINKLLKNCIDKNGYLLVNLSNSGNVKSFKIHNLVWDYFGDKDRSGHTFVVDHIDNDKLNNHITNLQVIPQSLNCQKDVDKTKTSSKYIGVYYHKKSNRWISYGQRNITMNNQRIYIGSFLTEEDAYIAIKNLGQSNKSGGINKSMKKKLGK